jgi:hypothetical protein
LSGSKAGSSTKEEKKDNIVKDWAHRKNTGSRNLAEAEDSEHGSKSAGGKILEADLKEDFAINIKTHQIPIQGRYTGAVRSSEVLQVLHNIGTISETPAVLIV